MTYEIKTSSAAFLLRPGALSDALGGATSDRSCLGRRCRPIGSILDEYYLTMFSMKLPMQHGVSIVPFYMPERPNLILFANSDLARCIALTEDLYNTNI